MGEDPAGGRIWVGGRSCMAQDHSRGETYRGAGCWWGEVPQVCGSPSAAMRLMDREARGPGDPEDALCYLYISSNFSV